MKKNVTKTKSEKKILRPPVVAILGHVDHGKTTLLDYIRKSKLVLKESGGITQHIGAYQISYDTTEGKKKITFIDTPGHEAFIKLRSRGANIADLAVLVVAADDGVKPQTIESIKHIKAAKIQMIVALNKIDLKSASAEKVKKQLAKEDVLVEDYKGDIVCVPISAKTGKGVDQLLEMIVLIAQMNNIGADSGGKFLGVVLESGLDKRRGVTCSLIVKNGKLNLRDKIFADGQQAKVRAIFDDLGNQVLSAQAGEPVEILGFNKPPEVGSKVFRAKDDDKIKLQKKPVSEKKEQVLRERSLVEENVKKPKIILKTDVAGSSEAILNRLGENIICIYASIGDINESDVLLAKASNAVIIGFNVHYILEVAKLAKEEKVIIKTYNIIYKLLDEISEVAESLSKIGQEEILGKAEVLKVFHIKKNKIAGCKVLEGEIARKNQVRVIRANVNIIGEAKVKSLRRVKTDIEKAKKNEICGLILSHELDFLPGDSIISYKIFK